MMWVPLLAVAVAAAAGVATAAGGGAYPLTTMWSTELAGPVRGGANTGLSPNGRVFIAATGVGSVDAVHAASGQILWSLKHEIIGQVPVPRVAVTDAAVVVGYDAGEDGQTFVAHGYDLANGDRLWKSNASINWYISTSEVAGDIVVIASGSQLLGVNATTGAVVWTSTENTNAPYAAAAKPTTKATTTTKSKTAASRRRRLAALAPPSGTGTTLFTWTVRHGWLFTYFVRLLSIATGELLYHAVSDNLETLSVAASDTLIVATTSGVEMVDWSTGAVKYGVPLGTSNLSTGTYACTRGDVIIFTDGESFVTSARMRKNSPRLEVLGTTTFPSGNLNAQDFGSTPGASALIMESFSGNNGLPTLTAFKLDNASVAEWSIVHPNDGGAIGFRVFAAGGGDARNSDGVLFMPSYTVGFNATMWNTTTGAELWNGPPNPLMLQTFWPLQLAGQVAYVGISGDGARFVAITVSA